MPVICGITAGVAVGGQRVDDRAPEGGARALVLLTPAGFEQLFREGGVPALDPTTPPPDDYDLELVARLSAKYGMDVVGPPLT